MAGPRAYGYVSDLPGPESDGQVKLKDLWGWAESQESTVISPAMYKEFFLPYLARLSAKFGLVYYGCCEPVHDRLELIMQAIPNLRSVSVSGWADFRRVAEILAAAACTPASRPRPTSAGPTRTGGWWSRTCARPTPPPRTAA
jgi:hypothetical protein